jgi:hypothetical protein
MDATDVEQARKELGVRERCEKTWDRSILAWQHGQVAPPLIVDLEHWAHSHGIEAVIWTALPPKRNGRNGEAPTIEQALEYLGNLSEDKRKEAEQYIRMAPPQIDTPYRRNIEAALEWTPFRPKNKQTV